MTINELREKRNKVWNDAKAFLDSHRTKNGILSAEDDATYSRMEQEINDLGREISRLERAAEIEKQLSQPTSDPITGQPGGKGKQKTGRASDAELRELFAGNGMIGYVAKERVDGWLLLPEAVQVLTIGSTTG